MAAGKHGSNEVIIEFEKADSVGSADTNITAYVTKLGDITLNKGAVESTPFGVSFPEYLAGVLKKYEPITLEGFYDDTATTGPDAIFNSVNAVARYWKITYGNGKYTSGRCWITEYKRGDGVGNYWTYTATIQPTGTIVEA
jgi:hypothetical protein